MYDLRIRRSAQKAMATFDKSNRHRIRQAIERLAENPRPDGCLKLSGREGWRIRIGSCRVLYDIDDRARVVTVAKVSQRGQAYR